MAALCSIASQLPPSVTMMMQSAMDALQWDNRKWWQASGYSRLFGNQRVVIFGGWESYCVCDSRYITSARYFSQWVVPLLPRRRSQQNGRLVAHSDQHSSPFPDNIQGHGESMSPRRS